MNILQPIGRMFIAFLATAVRLAALKEETS